MSRYVFDYFDGFRIGEGAGFTQVRLVRIYTMSAGSGNVTNEWPRKRDKYIQLAAESDEALNEQIAIWRKVGCPATTEEMRAAVDEYNRSAEVLS